MRPWQHAKSSAGGRADWRVDLPIHEFLDSTKLGCADLRHRMILHNSDLGPAVAGLVFPERHDARSIALRHIGEDLGCTPSLADWISECNIGKWPRPPYRRNHLDFGAAIQRITSAHALHDEGEVQAILDLLLMPTSFAGAAGLAVFFNSFGPSLVRQVVGGPRIVHGRRGETVFDPAHVAEALIYSMFGTIPHLNDIALTCDARAFHKESAGHV